MGTEKNWERPWSMEEIIESSDKWTLAGDVALLNTLKQFADNLLGKVKETNNNLQDLTKTLDETQLQLNIVENEFHGLRNKQFIESRVYEDDEVLAPTDNNQNEIKDEDKVEAERTEQIRSAALKGLEVLDKYFDKVEVTISDTEDDDIDLPSYVLTPKDLYLDRPLPYVIGSEEWHKSWHVGLESSPTDSETEKASDAFSESDSESNLPLVQDRSQVKTASDVSSELDFMPQKKGPDSDSDHSDPLQVRGSNSNRSFAEQLAAKLDSVARRDGIEPEINTRPIQKKSEYGDAFFDHEPPPLLQNGLFKEAPKLFDDDDDDDRDSLAEGLMSTNLRNEEPVKVKDLFDDDSSDGDMFSTERIETRSKMPSIFSDEPPAFTEKKNINYVPNILEKDEGDSRPDLQSAIKKDDTKKFNLFDDMDDLFINSKGTQADLSEPKSTTRGLFDSDEEEISKPTSHNDKPSSEPKLASEDTLKSSGLFEKDLFDDDDLFSSGTKKEFTSNLFSDFDDDDLFTTITSERATKESSSLFDDVVSIPDSTNSININTKTEIRDEDAVSSTPQTIREEQDEDVKLFIAKNLDKPETNLFESPSLKPAGLFPTLESENDSKNDHPSTILNFPFEDSGGFSAKDADEPTEPKITNNKDRPLPNLRLFDPSPPPDDMWEAKSGSSSDEIDYSGINYNADQNFEPAFLREVPPPLDFIPNESKVSKLQSSSNSPGKLKHNLAINVRALIPGAAPPKLNKRLTQVQESIEGGKEETKSNDEPDKVATLETITKHRARMPVGRRPSTRHARKTALRNSGADFKLDPEKAQNESEDISTASDVSFQPQTDVRTVKDTPPSLFDDENDSDDLFTSKLPAAQEAKRVKSLFDDDDDDDDDDFFKSFTKTNSEKKTETKMSTEKKTQKSINVKKLENTKSDDDPLSVMQS